MRRPRIHTRQPLAIGTELVLEPQASRHLSQVLRLRPGSEVILFDGAGCDWPARLLETGRDGVRLRIEERSPPEPPAPLEIHLGIGISRGERMDYAIQKAVELGVTGITPLQTARSVVRLPARRLQKRLQHWQGVVIAACEQCGRRRLPMLAPQTDLDDWLSGPGERQGLILDHRAEHGLHQLPRPDHPLYLLAGPEGGLTDAERDAARAGGFTAIRLGPRVLRTETAPLAAIAAVQTLWGDFV